jgi:DNA-binding IscR family transcriptional regulator
MFQAPDFTKASGLSKPHAARVIKSLLQHGIVKIISEAGGSRLAIYGFSGLIKIIESEQVA